MPYSAWPPHVRTLANALDAAIAAARSRDADGLAEQLALLDRVEPELLGKLLGDVLRGLVERTYPDGLNSDDAEALLAECRAESPSVEWSDDALALALTGALGVAVDDDASRPSSRVVLRHGVLVIAYLLSVAGARSAPLIEAALRELQREQTIELP